LARGTPCAFIEGDAGGAKEDEIMAEMLDRLSLTVVVDDAAGQDSALRAQHGLSVWMEGVAGEQTLRLLLDVGQSFDTLRHNMSLLGLAPGSLDALVLSHGHYDHTGGMASLVRATDKALPVVAHPDLFRPIVFLEPGPRSIGVRPEDQRPAVQAAGGVLLLSTDPVPLGPGMTTTGVVPRSSGFEESLLAAYTVAEGHLRTDPLEDDLAVVARIRGRGLVVVTGCSHAGIVNVVRRGMELFPGEALDGVVGGFHLGSASAERLTRTLDALEELAPRWIAPGHCTGFEAQRAFKDRFGAAFVRPYAGLILTVAPDEELAPRMGA